MEGYGIIMQIILGGVAGWLAEKIMNIILGIVGAVVGNFILNAVGFGGLSGLLGQLIVAVLGACVLILVYRAIKGRA